jgi:hypothetical protein
MAALSYGFASGWGLGLIIFTIHYIFDVHYGFESRLWTLKATAQIHETCGVVENANTFLRKNW